MSVVVVDCGPRPPAAGALDEKKAAVGPHGVGDAGEFPQPQNALFGEVDDVGGGDETNGRRCCSQAAHGRSCPGPVACGSLDV